MGIIKALRSLFGAAPPPAAEERGVVAQRQAPEPRQTPPPRQEWVSPYLSSEEAASLLVPDERGVLPVTIQDGFFVHKPTGKKFPAANRVMAAHGVISFRVRGTQHSPGHRTANTSPGEPAILRREPKNEFDPNAVAVYALLPSGRASKVGYVNKGLARTLARRMDGGENLEARFMRGFPPGETGEVPCVVVTDETFAMRIPGWPA